MFLKPHVTARRHVNIIMLLRIIGYLLTIEAGFMVLPLITSIVFKEPGTLWLLLCVGITGVSGMGMMFLRPRSREMGKREAILLTSLIWVILSLFGMLPFILLDTHSSVTDAFFETMSGFTTTGASALPSLENVPKSLLLWRCVMQWIGGLGIILFTLAVVPMLNYQGGMQMFNAEVTGITHDKLRPRVSLTAKTLWSIYIGLTVIWIILLSFSNLSIFDAIGYGLSTVSTGGFGLYDSSLPEIGGIYAKCVMIAAMFISGINFALLYNIMHRHYKPVMRNTALKAYLGVVGVCYAIMVISAFTHNAVHSVADATINPLFQVVGVLSTTGVTDPDFLKWGPLTMILLILMMTMGACAGSTSGGAKIDRFIVLFKFLKNEFYKFMHPSAVTTVTINGKGTNPQVVQRVLAFLFVYALLILIGGAVLCECGFSIRDAFICTLSAISNTALDAEPTTIAGNYSLASPVAKWVLSFIMLAGRLELFTVLLIFTPSFWKK